MTRPTRRQFLTTSLAAAAASPMLGAFARAFGAETEERPYRIGIVDWNTSAKGTPEVFGITKALGYEGVQLSFEPEGKFDLRKPEVQQEFLAAAKTAKQQIASLGMSILNQRPFATDPDAERWVSDCIDIMDGMGQEMVLLAFFGRGDLKNKPAAQKATIERLRRLAPKAERLGKKLTIESTLNAEEHMRIIDAVASDAVTVYYDVANMTRMGYDIYEEIAFFGKKGLISQFHMKELNDRLGEGVIDFPKVRRALDAIDYRGWVVAERALRGDKEESQRHNAAYLKKVFDS